MIILLRAILMPLVFPTVPVLLSTNILCGSSEKYGCGAEGNLVLAGPRCYCVLRQARLAKDTAAEEVPAGTTCLTNGQASNSETRVMHPCPRVECDSHSR